jgi:cation transporter-like permease
MRDVGTAAAIGLATGIFGGVIGFLIARFLAERFTTAEGPGGLLFVVLIPGLTVLCTFVGFILAFWRLRKAGGKGTQAR